MHAIVLAGGTDEDHWAKEHGVKNKAFLPINDLPMIAYVVAALRESPQIGQIVVVGPTDALAAALPGVGVTFLGEQGDVIDNILAAIKKLPSDRKILICTSDIPFLTPEALGSLFASTEARDADFYYPIINRTDCEAAFPGVERTYAQLKEGSFTGGNIFIVDPGRVLPLEQVFRRLVDERKNPLKMLLTLGLPGLFFALRLLLGLLSVAGLEKSISKLLRIDCMAIYCRYPEIGTDVDKDSDLELARRFLTAGN